jgi:hypothetical protein
LRHHGKSDCERLAEIMDLLSSSADSNNGNLPAVVRVSVQALTPIFHRLCLDDAAEFARRKAAA